MKSHLMPVLLILIPVLLLGSIWYVPRRLTQLLDLARTGPYYICAAAVVLAFPILTGISGRSSSPALDMLVVVAGVLFGLFVYLILSTFALDLVRLAVPVPERIGAWAVIGLAALVTLVGAWQACRFSVNEVEIEIPGLNQDVTFMLITDTHIGPQRGAGYLDSIVRETNRHNPDFVLLAGDVVDGNSALEPGVLDGLTHFEAPVYYTTGNHEGYIDFDRALAAIASHNVRILHNEAVETHGLQLVGLDYMRADAHTHDMHAVSRHTMESELPKIPLRDDIPAILMHHSPTGVRYAAERGIDLMLAGHTHAGQMFPVTLLAPVLFPFNAGLYNSSGTQVFVSQGAGTFGPRLRVGTSNEINLIRLRRQH